MATAATRSTGARRRRAARAAGRQVTGRGRSRRDARGRTVRSAWHPARNRDQPVSGDRLLRVDASSVGSNREPGRRGSPRRTGSDEADAHAVAGMPTLGSRHHPPRVPATEETLDRLAQVVVACRGAGRIDSTTRMSRPLDGRSARVRTEDRRLDAAADRLRADSPTHPTTGRDAEPVTADLVGTCADGHQRVAATATAGRAGQRNRAVRAASLVRSSTSTRVRWGRGRDQADSFLRPLARRAASTLRPPCVFIRARKPVLLGAMSLLGLDTSASSSVGLLAPVVKVSMVVGVTARPVGTPRGMGWNRRGRAGPSRCRREHRAAPPRPADDIPRTPARVQERRGVPVATAQTLPATRQRHHRRLRAPRPARRRIVAARPFPEAPQASLPAGHRLRGGGASVSSSARIPACYPDPRLSVGDWWWPSSTPPRPRRRLHQRGAGPRRRGRRRRASPVRREATRSRASGSPEAHSVWPSAVSRASLGPACNTPGSMPCRVAGPGRRR